MRPLVLTGGPAAGKSSTARELAGRLERAAAVDVDDLRHLVEGGVRAPWDGVEGRRQHALCVESACDLVVRFRGSGFDAVVADVVTTRTLPIYRRRLPDALVLRLGVSFGEARRRSGARREWLTDGEFAMLHHDAEWRPEVDLNLAVDGLDPDAQVDAVMAAWLDAPAR